MIENVEANPNIDVNCRQMAVSGASGSIEIAYDPSAIFTTTASVYPADENATKTHTVIAVTLFDIFQEEGLSKIDLLKIDCEGSEFSILYQSSLATLSQISQMAIEVHPNHHEANNNADALRRFLNAAGFVVRTNDQGTYLWAWQEAIFRGQAIR
jgi:FkbM family methyltransferase